MWKNGKKVFLFILKFKEALLLLPIRSISARSWWLNHRSGFFDSFRTFSCFLICFLDLSWPAFWVRSLVNRPIFHRSRPLRFVGAAWLALKGLIFASVPALVRGALWRFWWAVAGDACRRACKRCGGFVFGVHVGVLFELIYLALEPHCSHILPESRNGVLRRGLVVL